MMTFPEIIRLLHAGEVPPRPLNKKSPRYSASTVKQHKRCERKHWFEQCVGIDPPMTAALSDGTKTHGVIERYLKDGAIPGVGPNATEHERWASTGLRHLPAPGTPGMLVEVKRSMPTWPGGPEFTGTPDLIVLPETADPDDESCEQTAELYDHKTTSGYARGAKNGWVLTPETLPDDEQNISYSTFVFRARSNVALVDSTWIYYDKSGAPATAVKASMERKETLGKWRERILPIIGDMHRQHSERPALALVPANGVETGECQAFKGCPHRAYCIDYKGASVSNNTGETGDNKENKKLGKLSEQLMDGHAKEKESKKKDGPALNPPPRETKPEVKTEAKAEKAEPKADKKSPFATMDSEPPSAKELSEPQSSPKSTGTTKPTLTTPAASGGGFALFLGCEPVVSKRPRIDFATALAPIEERVAKANKVTHVGLVKYDGVHHTAAALSEWLDENGEEWDGANVVVGKSAFHQDVAERVLMTKAIAVARGVA